MSAPDLDPDWPGCWQVVTRKGGSSFCTYPVAEGEQFCARHGGKAKTTKRRRFRSSFLHWLWTFTRR